MRPGSFVTTTTARPGPTHSAESDVDSAAQAVAVHRLLSSSAVPMSAPGTVQRQGPSLPQSVAAGCPPTVTAASAETYAGAAQRPAEPAPTVEADADATVIGEPETTDAAAPDVAPNLEEPSTDPGIQPGQEVVSVPGLEGSPQRRKALRRSGVSARDVAPLTSPSPGTVDEAAAVDAERGASAVESELDTDGPVEGEQRVEPEVEEPAVPAEPEAPEAPLAAAPEEPAAEGGAGDDVAAWQGRVQSAATEMAHPEPAPSGTYSEPITAAGGAGTKALKKKAEDIPLEAKKVMEAKPPTPLPEAPGVPAPDPVPGATLRLKELAVRKLPDQKLPKLLATPHGILPSVGGPPVDTKVPPTPPPAPKTKPGKRSPTPVKDVNEVIAQGPPVPAPGEGQTLTGSERLPTQTIAEPHRADIAKVLARVYLQAQGMGAEVLKDARATAYSKDISGINGLEQLGKEQEQQETLWFRQELDRVAEAALIGKAALDAAVVARAKEVEQGNEAHAEEVAKATQEQVAQATEAGTMAQSVAEATFHAWEGRLDAMAAAAKGDVDPKAVRAEQERVSGDFRTFASTHTTAWASMRKVRERDLNRAGQDQYTAYLKAALLDQAQLDEQNKKPEPAKPLPPKTPPAPPVAPTAPEVTDPALKKWLEDRKGELEKAVGALRTDLGKTVDGWTTELNKARDEGLEAARKWADGRIGRERNWLMRLLAEFLQSLAVKKEDNKALEEAQTNETVTALGGTLQVINDLKLGGMERVDRDGRELLAQLSDEENALLKAYFDDAAKGHGDTVALLASLLSIRLKRQRKPLAQKYIRDQVLALDNVQYWAALSAIGALQQPGFKASTISDKLWEAFEHTWGTDEEKAIAAVKGGLTAEQAKAVRGHYKAHRQEDLDARIESELSDTDKQRVEFGLNGKQAEADAAAMAEAMGHVFSTDQTLMRETLRNKTPEERRAIAEAYKRLYGRDLVVDFTVYSRGEDRQIIDALWAGNKEKADAIEIKVAREGFWGPDHDEIAKVYTRVRDEATQEGDARGWKTADINAEIARRTGKMAGEYAGVTKRNLMDDLKKSFTPPTDHIADPAQRKAVEQYWAGRRDLVIGLAEGDLTKADAGRIQIERTGVYADDNEVNKVLALQYSRAYENARRDAIADFVAKNGRHPNKKDMETLETEVEATAKRNGKASMGALGSYFETNYTGGKESFRETIEDLTSGVDEEKATTLVDQGGFLEDWQVLEFATKGAGTDEDEFKRVIKKQKTKADQNELEKLWQRKTNTSRTIQDLIDDETSGRLKQDLEVDNEFGGAPTDPAVMVAKAEKQLDFERRSGGESTYVDEDGETHVVQSAEYQDLLVRLDELKAAAKACEELKDDDPRKEWAQTILDVHVESVASGIETHRFLVDQRTEIVAQVVTMAVTIAVAALITIGTGGVGSFAGAALIAGVSSLFGAAAGMITKASMKGAAYGADEIATDAALGVVDAAVSAATAGFGGKLLKGATAAAKTAGTAGRGVAVTIGRMAEGSALKRAAAHAITEGAEGFLQSLPTAVLGTALDEKTWSQGNPLFNMLAGVGMGVGMGTFASGTLGGLGALRGAKGGASVDLPDPGYVPAAQGRLVDLVPGTPAHANLEARYFEVNPGRSHADFQRDLDGLVILQAKYNPEVKARLEARLRENIGDLLPAGQKSAIAGNPIEMWDAKRFEEFTGSHTGQALVVVKDGHATVIVKQGADPHELAQEGFHLLQALDPTTRSKVARLDESVMRGWSTLDVREKFSLYKEKLDLELDAQRRMVAALEERAGVGSKAVDPELGERLSRAKETLDNLKRRANDMSRIGPLQRQLMAWGVLRQPSWLDQPARLFAKAPPRPPTKAKSSKKGKQPPPTGPPDPLVPPPPPRPLEESHRIANNVLQEAGELERAYRAGLTIEPRGQKPLPIQQHPRLTEQMDRMAEAQRVFHEEMAALRAAGGLPDPAAYEDVVMRLQRSVSDAGELLRSFGHRFDVETTPELVGAARASAHADVANRATQLRPRASSPQDIVDALTAWDVSTRASGQLSEPLSRRLPGLNMQQYLISAREIGDLPTRPSWLGRRLSRMFFRWEQAHLVGPGFGAELFEGIMLAPRGVNQTVQNKAIEDALRTASGLHDVHISVQGRGRRLAIPLTDGTFQHVDIMETVDYHMYDSRGRPLYFKDANGVRRKMKFSIEVDADARWRVHADLPPGSITPAMPMNGRW